MVALTSDTYMEPFFETIPAKFRAVACCLDRSSILLGLVILWVVLFPKLTNFRMQKSLQHVAVAILIHRNCNFAIFKNDAFSEHSTPDFWALKRSYKIFLRISTVPKRYTSSKCATIHNALEMHCREDSIAANRMYCVVCFR